MCHGIHPFTIIENAICPNLALKMQIKAGLHPKTPPGHRRSTFHAYGLYFIQSCNKAGHNLMAKPVVEGFFHLPDYIRGDAIPDFFFFLYSNANIIQYTNPAQDFSGQQVSRDSNIDNPGIDKSLFQGGKVTFFHDIIEL